MKKSEKREREKSLEIKSATRQLEGRDLITRGTEARFGRKNNLPHIKNVRKIEFEHYEIRFKYTDQLTGKQREVRRRVHCNLYEAIEIRDELKVKARNGGLKRDNADPTLTVREFADFWHEQRGRARSANQVAPSTHASEDIWLKKHILPEMGEWRVAKIQLQDLEQVREKWASKRKSNGDFYSPHTVNGWIRCAKKLLRDAFTRLGKSAEIIGQWKQISTKNRRKRGTALTRQQRERFLGEMKRQYVQHFALTYMLFTTGQRFSTVSSLEWSDIDFSARIIRFDKSQYEGEVKYGSKSGKVLTFQMTDDQVKVLRDHQQRLMREQHPGLSSGLVFPARVDPGASACNGYQTNSTLTKPFRAVSNSLSIEPAVTPHDARRTFNSICLEAGVSPNVLRKITGHSCERMTDHYYRPSQEAKAQAIQSGSVKLESLG